MTRQFDKDPTEFFSVVGAPYVRERHGAERVQERRTGAPRAFDTGAASVFAGFCVVMLSVLLFASSGAAKLVEVAYQAVR